MQCPICRRDTLPHPTVRACDDCEAPIAALTLWQPWATLVAKGRKNIENRSWAPGSWVMGRRIAIHAGQSFDFGDGSRAEAPDFKPWPRPENCEAGAILATVRIVGFLPPNCEPAKEEPWWYREEFGWQLSGLRVVRPAIFNIRGRQKLWRLTEPMAAEILRRQAQAQ